MGHLSVGDAFSAALRQLADRHDRPSTVSSSSSSSRSISLQSVRSAAAGLTLRITQ